MTIKRKSIQVTQEVYEALSKLKREQSFDAFLRGVALILERDNTSVKNYEEPIEKALKVQANRIIEVMRGIEKKQEKHLLSILQQVLQQAQQIVPPASPSDEGLSEEDRANIEAMIALNKEQSATISKLQGELNKVRTQLELEGRKVASSLSQGLDEEAERELMEQIYKLEGKMSPDYLNKSSLNINKADFKVIIDTLKRTIVKYGSGRSRG